MTQLRPCSACDRHVRIDADACPFCGETLEAQPPRKMPVGRLTRAAVFASALATTAAVGCKKDAPDPQKPHDDQAAADAGADEPPPPPDKDVPPPDHDVPMPYGAPPARARLV